MFPSSSSSKSIVVQKDQKVQANISTTSYASYASAVDLPESLSVRFTRLRPGLDFSRMSQRSSDMLMEDENIIAYQQNRLPARQLMERINNVNKIRFYTRSMDEKARLSSYSKDIRPVEFLSTDLPRRAPFFPSLPRPRVPPFPLPIFEDTLSNDSFDLDHFHHGGLNSAPVRTLPSLADLEEQPRRERVKVDSIEPKPRTNKQRQQQQFLALPKFTLKVNIPYQLRRFAQLREREHVSLPRGTPTWERQLQQRDELEKRKQREKELQALSDEELRVLLKQFSRRQFEDILKKLRNNYDECDELLQNLIQQSKKKQESLKARSGLNESIKIPNRTVKNVEQEIQKLGTHNLLMAHGSTVTKNSTIGTMAKGSASGFSKAKLPPILPPLAIKAPTKPPQNLGKPVAGPSTSKKSSKPTSSKNTKKIFK